MATTKPRRRRPMAKSKLDEAVEAAKDKQFNCPFPFDSFDACVARMSEEEDVDDPEAMCAAWEEECGEGGKGKVVQKNGRKPDGKPLELKLLVSRLEVKQVNVPERTFEGLAATWDEDLGGDIIERGAFADTIADWERTGRVLPLLDSHNWFSVRDVVGKLLKAKEMRQGLWTKWKIVPGVDGDEILTRLRPDGDDGPYLDSMSIGYRPVRWEILEDQDEGTVVRILKEVELHEVSLVLFPMNPAARIDSDSVKRFATSVKQLVDKAPEQVREELREAVRTQLTLKRPPVPVPVPVIAVEPKPKTEPKKPVKAPDRSEIGNEDTAPDLSKYDQLRLRRLELTRGSR